MYPFIRLIKTTFRAKMLKNVPLDSTCELTFHCRPWDIDLFGEMNNGRILTLFDLGRFDIVFRSGFGAILKKKKWGLVVAGSTVRYRKRIKMFNKVTIRTQIMGFDERWIYVAQSMWVKGKPASSILLRTGITSRGKIVPTEDVAAAFEMKPWNHDTSGWLESWIASEEKRPWPPA